MNRRTTLIAPLAMASGLLLPKLVGTAEAATSPTLSAGDYKMKVLRYGTLAKLTSIIALKTSSNPYVQQFANGEIEEQTAVARSLTSLVNPPPASLTDAQKADLAMVQDAASAGTLDATYIDVQISGHRALLELQEAFLGSPPMVSQDYAHIALIARAFIRNHLVTLADLKAANA